MVNMLSDIPINLFKKSLSIKLMLYVKDSSIDDEGY